MQWIQNPPLREFRSGCLSNFNIALSLAEQASHRPEACAIDAGGRTISYGELAAASAALAGELNRARVSGRVGILGTRSIEAYVGVLGAGWAGSTYVPLNLKWPAERLVALFRQLDLDALVTDEAGAQLLTPEVIASAPDLVVVPAGGQPPASRAGQRILRRSELGAPPLPAPAQVGPDATAYIIFTSGTTGLPKGVMISAGSLDHYLEQGEPWTRYRPEDRIGEACDLTFDLSVHNLFLCLRAGASLHVLSQLEMLAPARFIRAHVLTAWMSVPTIIALMRRNGTLKPGAFPSLRLSIFCGEPLPLSAAQAWAEATPNGVVENIYGPTECTVVGLRQQLTTPPVVTEGRDIIAIGRPFPTMKVAILDERQRPVPAGEPGEIALAGPQVGIGYLGQEELTADRFRMIDGERWYLTGDLGRMDGDGAFHHLGRVDNQIKLKGNRVELEEIDAHLRRVAGTELAATIAWPMAYGSAEGLVAFIAGSTVSPDDIRQGLSASLPRFLVPGRIIICEELPRNINGKIDRGALARMVEADARQTAGDG